MSRGNEEKTSATLKDFKEHLYYVIFFKSTVYVYRTTFNTVIRTFLGEGGGALIKYFEPQEGRLFEGGAYWKLGAYSSIYSKWTFSSQVFEITGTLYLEINKEGL